MINQQEIYKRIISILNYSSAEYKLFDHRAALTHLGLMKV